MPSKNDEHVIALSEFLRSMDLHKEAQKNEKFRNPDGVAFKVGNIRAVATGKGLQNTANMDRSVWEEFNRNREALSQFCSNIRDGVEALKSTTEQTESEDEAEFNEGKILTKLHKTRERNKSLRAKLIKKLAKEDRLYCEMCGVKPLSSLGEIALKMFECHHVIPISSAVRDKIKLSELSLLCANCHRLIHAAISKERRWLKPKEAAKLLDFCERT